MAHEHIFVRHSRPFLVFLALTTVFNAVCHVSLDYKPHVVRLHEALIGFTARGQATVELFAPLSTVVGSSPSGQAFLSVASHLVWPLVGIYFWKLLQRRVILVGNFWVRAVLYTCFIGIVCLSSPDRHQHTLSLLNELADAILALSLVMAITWDDHPYWLRVSLFLGLGEALVLTSFALGCNNIDALVAYFLLFVARGKIFAQKVADPCYSAISLTCEGISNLFIPFVVWPMFAMLLSGIFLPTSESAAGGNYNLRYFSASARRDLTPFSAIRPSLTHISPGFSLQNGAAYTLYVPSAGFLWTDSMVWTQSIPENLRNTTNHYDDGSGKYWSTEGSYRAFFQDKFIERYPWKVQERSQQPPKLRNRSPLTIRSGSTVRLYGPETAQHLCVIPGERVVSESGYFGVNGSTEQPVNRIRLGTHADPTSPHCDWTVYYNPIGDGGISFYNQEHQCSVSTTFRSLRDLNPLQNNDTVLDVLRLKVEASCTVSASEASSRLFLIDSTRTKPSVTIKKETPKDKTAIVASVGFIRRAMDHLEARRRLSYFRRYHGHLQEEAVGTLINDIEGEARRLDIFKPEILICSLYISVWLLDTLSRRRLLSKAAHPFQAELPARAQLGVFFIVCHLCAYYMLKTRMLYSSRVAGLVGLYSLIEYLMAKA